LFNAGAEWEEALSRPAVATYAEALAGAHASMAAAIEALGPSASVSEAIAQARHDSREAGFSEAASFAERAFARVLLSTAGDLQREPSEVLSQWNENRGPDPSSLVSRFAGELLDQFSRYAVDRESGRLALADRGADVSAAISVAVGRQAAAIGEQAAAEALSGTQSSIRDAWDGVIRRAFSSGETLPEATQ
jgi:hypothetical protein